MAGMRGRPPKPTALRILGGNAGHRPLPDDPLPRAGVPDRPSWMAGCGICGLEWEKLVTELQLQRVMALKYGFALDVGFREYHEYHSARDRLATGSYTQTTESGYVAPHPDVGIANRALSNMIRLFGEFGWTPSSNTRLRVPPPEDADQGESDEEFFGGRHVS